MRSFICHLVGSGAGRWTGSQLPNSSTSCLPSNLEASLRKSAHMSGHGSSPGNTIGHDASCTRERKPSSVKWMAESWRSVARHSSAASLGVRTDQDSSRTNELVVCKTSRMCFVLWSVYSGKKGVPLESSQGSSSAYEIRTDPWSRPSPLSTASSFGGRCICENLMGGLL